MLSILGPYTRLGTVLSALIIVFGMIGMTMHRDFYAGRLRKDFLCFYTNVSNVAVLVYFGLVAPHLYARPALHSLIPHTEFAVMMSIMLTFSVFHLVLFPTIRAHVLQMPRTREYRIVCADNFIIHYFVPLMVFAYWLLCSPDKQVLGPGDALYWTVLPLIYVGFIFIRAPIKGVIEEAGSPYPYPFLDVHILGSAKVLRICAILYSVCILIGLTVIALIRMI